MCGVWGCGRCGRAPEGQREDPWTDSKWSDVQWTVYRGQAYDLTAFLKSHPGGNWLINLALKVRVFTPVPARVSHLHTKH